MSRFLTAHQHS